MGNVSADKDELAGNGEVGARLRRLRKARHMTLRQVSAATGLAVSTLSKAELGQTALSYAKFARLAQALDVDMTWLFVRDRGGAEQPRPVALKDSLDDVQHYVTGTYDFSLIFGEYPAKRMKPMVARIDARDVSEFDDYIRHPGQEFAIVLSGKLRISFESGESIVLARHETAYFDSGVGHVYLSLSRRPARVLVVCCD
ncbi:XRE family transcriptional regulator [Allopusillimonas soli]|uniref:Helix-turn-helix transcriptional regulator n=1 Tax=Allopusillimonas soli TaxID=659016 RepID=A0A853FCC9_9BURK|nr:XRE family transcriptional regulator [Allopusillimonas soli]NYT37418.1 helix-turn-helix transcriptional regulator [Allopusillimonas soli]TEA74600.1 XRE family transcriptional regulator [Allopusillimonas soli]